MRIKGHNIKAAGESAIILPNPKPTFNNTNLLLIVTYVRIFLKNFCTEQPNDRPQISSTRKPDGTSKNFVVSGLACHCSAETLEHSTQCSTSINQG